MTPAKVVWWMMAAAACPARNRRARANHSYKCHATMRKTCVGNEAAVATAHVRRTNQATDAGRCKMHNII